MAKVLVKLHGEEVCRLTLEPGMEYIAGRAQDAQIVLGAQRGISRQHLKFYQKDDHWVVQSMSNFVLIQKGDSQHEVLELTENMVFTVTPYEFHFERSGETNNIEDPAKPSENLPAPVASPRFQQAPINPSEPVSEDTSPKVNNEATVAGGGSLVPYLRISSPNSSEEETLKLEGHLWVAGRESTCEIFLENPHISRKHFELVRMNEGFFVSDLGSSNGTKLNGQRLPPHEPTKLESGDTLSVQQIEMVFEIRDTQFMNRLSNLPATIPVPDNFYLPQMPVPWNQHSAYEATQYTQAKSDFPNLKNWKDFRPRHLKEINWKKHKVRLAIAVCAVLILIMSMTEDAPQSKREVAANTPQGAPGNVPFEKMTNEQKNAIKDSFNLSRNLYVQGKYELCLAELTKLHEMIPFFENSKELGEFCQQGRELVIRQKDLERKERERAMIEQQIGDFVEACKAKLSKYANVATTRQCLVDAIELDPEHPLITSMLAAAQQREEERKIEGMQKKAAAVRAAKGQQQFDKARALYQKGRLAKALKEYEAFLDSTYPNSEGNKNNARRDIASIRKELKVKVGFLVDQCRTFGEKGRFKDAYLACDKAVDEDPSNQTAKDTRAKMLSELRREIKSVYEDSVLEESMGNVDAAKEKWNKIIKENLDFDDYTHKAKSKLQKYGVGI